MFKIVSNFRDLVDGPFLNFCLKYLKSKDRVVEIGPGDAEFADSLMKNIKDLDYTFIDIQDRRTYQKQQQLKRLDVSYQDMDFPEGSLDAIIASQVVEHLKNPSHFFMQANKVLKPGGVLLLKIPNFGNIFHRVRFLLKGSPFRLNGTIDDGGHINFCIYQHLVDLIKDYFELQKITGDVFVDLSLTKMIFKLLKKDAYLVNGNIRSLCFSWNAILCFKKKENKK